MSVIELIQETETDGTPSRVWRGPRNEYVGMYAVTESPNHRPGPEHVAYEIEGQNTLTVDELDKILTELKKFKKKYPPHLVRPANLPIKYRREASNDNDPGYWYANRAQSGFLFCESIYDPQDDGEIRYVVETTPEARPMTINELYEFALDVCMFFYRVQKDLNENRTDTL